MYIFTVEQRQTLIDIISEEMGSDLTFPAFADAMLRMFEDIPGFETIPPMKANDIVNQLWRIYMSKNPVETSVQSAVSVSEKSSVTKTAPLKEPVKIDLNRPVIQQAIKQGKALISEGKSKADAARAIYVVIKDEAKEVIVAAFVEGATLTEKGALTYWYNCKRRASKEAKKSTE